MFPPISLSRLGTLHKFKEIFITLRAPRAFKKTDSWGILENIKTPVRDLGILSNSRTLVHEAGEEDNITMSKT